jgi:hypothetical protein
MRNSTNYLIYPVLFIIFFVFMSPINKLLRFFSFDPLNLNFEKRKESYFVVGEFGRMKKYSQKGILKNYLEDGVAPDTIYPMW